MGDKSLKVDSVVALVSHDLLTPLTAIYLELELLLKNIVSNPEQRNSKLLNNSLLAIRCSCEHAIGLVRNLLDASAVESDVFKLSKKRAWANSFIIEAVHGLVPQAKKNGIDLEIKYGKDFESEFDPERLRQVFWNLIGNSLKLTPRGGKITVSVEERSRDILFRVQDTGPGLTEDQLKDLFEKRYTGKQSNPYSLSLGLFISKNIVVQHGGKIWASTGSGTTISFTIPKQ